MLYIIYAESANYCGYGQHFVVKARNASQAEDLAEMTIENYFLEQDEDQLNEDGINLDDAPLSSIMRVEDFGPEHECWEFYQDPGQAEFYTKVNL